MTLEQANRPADGFPSDLLLDLRADDGRGLRERLEHGLRSAIQRRRLVAGTLLPPTRVLAAELGISRSVVVEAYANLAADGYVEARQGAGTRVRLDVRDSGRPRGRDGRATTQRASSRARAILPSPARRRPGCSAACPTRRCSRGRSGCATTAPRWRSCPTRT